MYQMIHYLHCRVNIMHLKDETNEKELLKTWQSEQTNEVTQNIQVMKSLSYLTY